MSFKLEIIRTETANTYTTTALASTVTLAEVRADGEERTEYSMQMFQRMRQQ